MLTWFHAWLYDEDRFKAGVIALVRGLVAGVGYCLDQQLIPTGIPGGGEKYGRALFVVAMLITQRRR